ncbi:hypothetical protein MHYP_G00215360 [Metynnis hypsauchen]
MFLFLEITVVYVLLNPLGQGQLHRAMIRHHPDREGSLCAVSSSPPPLLSFRERKRERAVMESWESLGSLAYATSVTMLTITDK